MFSKVKYLILVGAILGSSFVGLTKTANAAPYWSQELLANGGFENSTHGYQWTQFHGDIFNPCTNDCLITNSGSPYSGSYQAILGGEDNHSDVLSAPAAPWMGQYFNVPSNAEKIVLSFKYQLTSNDVGNDTIRLYVGDMSILDNPIPVYTFYSDDDRTTGWTKAGLDISQLGGKPMLFYFFLTNDNTPGTATTFYIDDVSITAYYTDTTKPTGSIRINSNKKSTKKAKVTLNLSASDNVSGVAYMRFSNNGKKWSGWYTYATTKRWDMTKKAYGGSKKKGTKKVYVQFRDGMGNISKTYKDSIKYK